MPSSRCRTANDLCPTHIDNVTNLSPQGLPQLKHLGTQLRHFLGPEVVDWSGIQATLHNPMRQFLGFIAERRYFVGTR
jgi:hypothetical protein